MFYCLQKVCDITYPKQFTKWNSFKPYYKKKLVIITLSSLHIVVIFISCGYIVLSGEDEYMSRDP